MARLWAEVLARALRDVRGQGCYCRLERQRALEFLAGGAALELLVELGWTRGRAGRALRDWLSRALQEGRARQG